jgi:hypothetical protein
MTDHKEVTVRVRKPAEEGLRLLDDSDSDEDFFHEDLSSEDTDKEENPDDIKDLSSDGYEDSDDNDENSSSDDDEDSNDMRYADRYDVRASTYHPCFANQKKTAIDGMSVLDKIDWTTTHNPERGPCKAKIILKGGWKRRHLTEEEWNAIVVVGTKSGYVRDGYWIMLHENAGLMINTAPMPECRAMARNSTVIDVLRAIHEMTVKRGPFASADSVYFEGLCEVAPGIVCVRCGS